MTTTMEIRAVTGSDRDQVASALAAAFYHDPVFAWIYPDDNRRRAVLPAAFEIFTDALARHGVSLAADDGVGAALWVPPGATVVDDEDAEAFGEALAALSPEDADRLVACMQLLDETHPHEPCWYLNLLGVVPERQGEGIGSALLRPSLERCDRDGIPAYLEATSDHNRRLYERHGFRTVAELPLPGGPSLWAMWRRPVGP